MGKVSVYKCDGCGKNATKNLRIKLENIVFIQKDNKKLTPGLGKNFGFYCDKCGKKQFNKIMEKSSN